MSKDISSVRFTPRTTSKNAQLDGNENEFDKLSNPIHLPPQRTPLHTIPDPSQYQREVQETDFDSLGKFEGSQAGQSSDRKIDASDNQMILNKGIGIPGTNYGTPRVSGRGKVHSEPSSVQSTPSRSVSRTLHVNALGAFSGPKPPQCSGVKGGSFSRVSRGISIVNSEPFVELQHFELVEDSSFWKDRNVQVLIRIRPINIMESVCQGYGRCLRQESAQTLVWLGHPETRFTYDHIACETISQEKLFMVAGLPMVDNCMSGYNSCMFAYGQTGSGKTYTMMGEICQIDGKLSEDCGVTPRIFEYLFRRIKEEEDSRRDERLKYSCKCSFLEIYNEQITDLLEPSSTNLQLREDLKKGVYVENLTEYNVRTVNDVLRLLSQGSANKKMAATHMNCESSRSHSVFTCIIESCWEKDSMTHLRFGRLNLVDLAGSERQKSSGAEGDRLKEAANINKSLSTLGLVIMSLVDLAHGKQRHVPYRDSRLTFLLQDSLGGNSKTTIIANVSPSICSANETLSTLKFAQRAKLIQNNAKVNEDASGDVTALQRQIQQLKGQLSSLMKNHTISSSLSHCEPRFQQSSLGDFPEEYDSLGARNKSDDCNIPSVQKKKMKCLEATLVGALRREKLAETAVRRLEAEIEQMNRLAQQREEDAQRSKMLLRFREEKIKRLEMLSDGLVSADKYLIEENNALTEESELLRARIDRNPELTRFALENIRLIEQLQLLQDFYEQGERETLLAEVSELRDQLLEIHEGNYRQHEFPSTEKQDIDAVKELEDSKNLNSKLIREVDELRRELKKYMSCNQAAFPSVSDSLTKDPKEFNQTEKCSLFETISIRSDLGDEMASYNQPDHEVVDNEGEQETGAAFVIQSSDAQKELMDARFLIEALEAEQVRLIEELQYMREENQRYNEISSDKAKRERSVLEKHYTETGDLENQNQTSVKVGKNPTSTIALQAKLDRMTMELEEARLVNIKYQVDQASQLTRENQIELVCEQVEMETTKTIIHLQEEVAALQSELHERLCYMAEENTILRNTITAKEGEIKALCVEWEKATLDLTAFLVDGSKSLRDASGEIENIACSFPRVNVWIGEHVERAARLCVEKEETILQLQKSLEDAQKMLLEMELKLNSLKGATMALTEIQHQENDSSTKEANQLTTLLKDKVNMIEFLEKKLEYEENQRNEAEKRANAAFLVVKRLAECSRISLRNNDEGDISMSKLATSSEIRSHQISETMVHANAMAIEDIEIQVELVRLGILETKNAIHASCTETQAYLFSLKTDIHEAASLYMELIQGFLNDIHEIRKNFVQFRESHRSSQICNLSREAHKFLKHENWCFMLDQIRDELAEINGRLNNINAFINTTLNISGCQETADDLVVDRKITDCSTSGSNILVKSFALEERSDRFSSSCCSAHPGALDPDFEGGLIFCSDKRESENPERLVKKSTHNDTSIMHLKKEFMAANYGFSKLNVQLAVLFNEKEIEDCSYAGISLPESCSYVDNREQNIFKNKLNQLKNSKTTQVLQPVELMIPGTEADCHGTKELIIDDNNNQASSFFTTFEEAHATMKEADFMLRALLKANENAKQLTGMWKQTGENLMMEKASLIAEIEELRSSIHVKDGQNALLQDQIHCSLLEIANLMSLLEQTFLQVQRDVEQMFKLIYSDALAMIQDILHCICNSRSSIEDIWSEATEKAFASFVLYQCHVGEFFSKFPSLFVDSGFCQSRLHEGYLVENNLGSRYLTGGNDTVIDGVIDKEEGDQSPVTTRLEEEELVPVQDNLLYENLALKKELERKEVLLKGLLFDFSLLQESASSSKDIKDETEKLIVALSQIQDELGVKTNQVAVILAQHRKLEDRLADAETALSISNSDLEEANGALDIMSDQNAELRVLVKNLYLKNSEAEEQLEEQREVVKSLEKEILRLTTSAEKKIFSPIEDMEDELKRVTGEREQLREQVSSLQDRLDMVHALADENEAIAIESRQDSEASKMYAEQKEEEVKILEHSVEELEFTINYLEKKVYEMEKEVERHQLIRDSLELELQELRQRMLTVENITETMESENSSVEQPEDQLLRQLHNRSLELREACNRIRVLEEERAEQAKEIKQCKEYISELVLHAEAQASQYQQKYKSLEAMFREVKTDSSTSTSAAPVLDRTERSSMRTRGSSSPFRCIASLVQQMNLEKDQELSMARLRIEELEALTASQQKEVCMLNTRLAAAESMTHDVIRDLLGVKLDMTNYANLMEQYQLQKFVEGAQQQRQESIEREQEILSLRKQINDLLEERERCVSEVNKREADILSVQITVEQLQERDQLLTLQNDMLKKDKTNLKRRIAELDEMIRKLFGTQNAQPQMNIKGNGLLRPGDADLRKRLAHSERLLARVNDELDQYRKSEGSHAHIERKGRKQQV